MDLAGHLSSYQEGNTQHGVASPDAYNNDVIRWWDYSILVFSFPAMTPLVNVQSCLWP